MSFDRNFDKCSLAGRNERRGQEMKTSILARLVVAGAMLAAAAGAAPAQALKPWKHGIIAPKADAGFLLMAAKRGFAEREGLKLELLEVKDDQCSPASSTATKAAPRARSRWACAAAM